MKFLVIGPGGVGGSLAGFLALAGHEVACVSRGAHLEALRRGGLVLDSDLKGRVTLPVGAFAAGEYEGKPDVILVCTKTYSLSETAPEVARLAGGDTLVVPVMNGFGIGDRLAALVPGATVLDGCIYIVAYRLEPGCVAQRGPTFRLYLGPRRGQRLAPGRLDALGAALAAADIGGGVSDEMERETFLKWSFVSAMACAGAYFDVPMGRVSAEPEKRRFFAALAAEGAEVGRRLGLDVGSGLVERHLATIDVLDAGSLTSMQRDMAHGHCSEVDDLLVRMLRLGRGLGLEMTAYARVAGKLGV